jgi:hypothetical protein
VTDLRAWQADFAATLRAPQAPAGGMGVYHANHRANFRRALALAYPALERLVGADYFTQLSDEFQACTPSRSGDLHHAGAPFPAFVRAHFAAPRFAAARYRCLADVAELEWAHQESWLAADATPLDLGTLRDIAAADWPSLRWVLHPSLRLLHLASPVHAIWLANCSAADAALETPAIELGEGAQNLRLGRAGETVLVRVLSDGADAFWRGLATGATLAEATDAALAREPDFDLTAQLTAAFGDGMVTGCELRSSGLGSPAENT